MLRASEWSAGVRVVGFVLLVLASCPLTAPFQPCDFADPIDGSPAGAIVQVKGAVDDLVAASLSQPDLLTPLVSIVRDLPRSPSAGVPRPHHHLPLRI